MAGRNALDQHGAPPSGTPSGCGITQYAGRFSDSLPSPYVTQLPRLGNPISVRPLCSSYIAGAWTVLVHQHDRKKQMSSARRARFGKRSEISMPLAPCFVHLRVLGRSVSEPLVNWLLGRPVDSGS